MKKLLLLLILCAPLTAQTFISPSGAARRFVRVNGVPASCSTGDVMVDISVSPAIYYNCPVATPVVFTTGALSATGVTIGATSQAQQFTNGVTLGSSGATDGVLKFYNGDGLATFTVSSGAGAFDLAFLTAGTTGSGAVVLASGPTVANLAVTGTANFAGSSGITPPQLAGIIGTNTNNNANAGAIGEFTNAQCPGPATTATITVTIATPGVVTWSGHPFSGTAPRFDACPVVFTTTGALPTGITAGTQYWVVPSSISGNNFSIATSVANAIAGTKIATSGSQSGTQTGTAGSVLTTATAKDVTGLPLTAGDWDCSALLARSLGGTTSVTLLKTSISTTSATDGTIPNGTMDQYSQPAGVPANDLDEGIGPLRLLNSGTVNAFLVADDTFTLSTNKAYGTIRCRRVR